MTHDALIIGAGPAGSTAALLLARAGWSVALVERKAFPRRKVCGEYLSATNLPLFDRLGIGERFRDLAGPAVRSVGLFAGESVVRADLPRPAHCEWGRALAREHLDTWLCDQARAAGAFVFQPWSVVTLDTEHGIHHCQMRSLHTAQEQTLSAGVVIAAHGSWDVGDLPTQHARHAHTPLDLLAFKAHFLQSELPDGLMPLLAFPGGYGGMVRCEGGRVSLSCCVRRDCLNTVRRRYGGDAGEAVVAHIQDSCLGVRQALRAARREGPCLAAGPIRPGIRVASQGGIFLAGNAAGEAHPVVAEGISMALQSGAMLAERLVAWKRAGAKSAQLASVHRAYARQWRRQFAPRLWASRAIAHWAMRSAAVSLSLPFVRSCPPILTWGARLSGKASLCI